MKVLLASDGSDHSLRAAKYLGNMVRLMPDVTVTVVHVSHLPLSYQRSQGRSMGNLPMEGLMRRTASPVVQATAEALGLPADRVRTELLVGEPSEEIIEHARLEAMDMIVVGRRGGGRLTNLILGSVSYRVLHASPCPVLVVN